MKAPTLIRSIEQDLAAGHAAVVQIVSTGEALMERRLAEIPTAEWGDLSIDITPREFRGVSGARPNGPGFFRLLSAITMLMPASPMSAADLRAYMAEMEMANAMKEVDAMDRAEKARKELIKTLSTPR